MKRIAVTGASGFIGGALVRHLANSGSSEVVAISRRAVDGLPDGVRPFIVPDLAADDCRADIARALSGVDVVVHLAALAGAKGRSVDEMVRGNVTATEKLARLAVTGGVTRFVLVSTAQVSGAVTHGTPIGEASPDAPQDAYSRSKRDAEAAVQRVCSGSSTAWTIVRPPLVYGRGAKGAVAQLANLVGKGIPLPFGAVDGNKRGLIGVDNLVDFLALAARHPAATNQTFVVRDGETVSTRALIAAMAAAMQRRTRLLPVPLALLKVPLRTIGATRAIDRLLGDYRIDDSRARRELGWVAPCPMADEMKRWLGPAA